MSVASSPPGSPPRFQFSLRWLLIAVTVVALVIGLGAVPATQGLVGFILTLLLRGVLPTTAIVTAFYGKGSVRAFGIGATVSCVPLLTTQIGSRYFPGLVIGAISQLIAMAICGAAAIATRRWLIRYGLSD